MMPPKHKLSPISTIYTNTTKRTRRADSADEDDDIEESEDQSESEFYEIKDILDDRIRKGVLEYYIDWRGIDPQTKKPWKRNWEPAENITQAAVEDYERRQRERQTSTTRRSTRVRSLQPRALPSVPQKDPTPRPPKRRNIVSSSPSAPAASPAPRNKHRKGKVQVLETPARPHTPSLQIQVPVLSTQEKQEFLVLQHNNHSSLPTQSSYTQDDSGIGSLSPVDREPQVSGEAGVTVVSDSQKSHHQPASYKSGDGDSAHLVENAPSATGSITGSGEQVSQAIASTSSKSLGRHSLNHEAQTTTTGSLEDDESLFIPDTRPLPVEQALSVEDFVDAVNAAQQSPLNRLLSPRSEIDLDDLSPLSPTTNLLIDAQNPSQSEIGLVASQGSVRSSQERISEGEHNHLSLQPLIHSSTSARTSVPPLGQFSQQFSSCDQEFVTQLPPHQNSNEENLQDAQPQLVPDTSAPSISTERQPSVVASQEKASASGERDPISQTSRGDRGRHVTPKPDFVAEENLPHTPPVALRSIETFRSVLSEGSRRPPEAQIMDNRNPNAGAFSQTPSSRGPSLREKLNALRADYNYPLATASAEPSGSATPSGPPTAILDKPMDEPASTDGPLPLSQRVVSSSPPPFVRPSDLAGLVDEDVTMQSSAARIPDFGLKEYGIAVPLEGIGRSEYLDIVKDSTKAFRALLNLSDDDHPTIVDRAIERTSEKLEKLRRTIAHHDLNIEGTATQVPVTAEEEADWADSVSQKFYFLRLFLNLAFQLPKRVCIIADDGRLLDILERYLKGRNIIHTRPGMPRFDPGSMEGQINVDLLSMADLDRSINSRPDLIIAFDISFDAKDPGIKRLRGEAPDNRNGKITPIVHLLAPFSVEHIERCLPNSLQGLKRQQAIVKAIEQYVPAIKYMKNNDQDCDDDEDALVHIGSIAISLAGFLAQSVDWEIAAMPPLDLDLGSEESSSANELLRPALSGIQSRSLTPGGHKRSLSGDYESSLNLNTSKRQRLTPLGDVTHVSDSVQGSQLERALRELQQNLTETKREHLKKTFGMQESLDNAEKQIQSHLKHISQLQTGCNSTETRLKEHITELGNLHWRYESRTNEFHEMRQGRDALVEKVASAEIKRDHIIKENTKLKEEILQLQADLQVARDDLKAGGGTMADLEIAREESRNLSIDKSALEKKLESAKTDLEYIRKTYQDVSTTAVEHANQLVELEAQNETLKKKAEGAAAHFKSLSLNHEKDRHLIRVMELESTLASRDELLRRKEEELRELKKSRGMGTRTSSVQPRSPRLGHSRPVSPAPGNLVPIPVQGARIGSALRFGHEMR